MICCLQRSCDSGGNQAISGRCIAELAVRIRAPAVADTYVARCGTGVIAASAELEKEEPALYSHGCESLDRGPVTKLARVVGTPTIGLIGSSQAARLVSAREYPAETKSSRDSPRREAIG